MAGATGHRASAAARGDEPLAAADAARRHVGDKARRAVPQFGAWQVFGHERHLAVLRRAIDYVLEVLRAPEGGFYCAEDADSLDRDGRSVEGAFYTWTPDEIAAVLGPDAPTACGHWGISVDGNFEGRSIPNRMHDDAASTTDSDVEAMRARLASARGRRPRPGLDDKILTEWTAMTVSMLAEAAAAVGEDRWTAAAVSGAEFLVTSMRRDDGRWYRTWHRGGDEQSFQQRRASADHVRKVVGGRVARGDRRPGKGDHGYSLVDSWVGEPHVAVDGRATKLDDAVGTVRVVGETRTPMFPACPWIVTGV